MIIGGVLSAVTTLAVREAAQSDRRLLLRFDESAS